MSQRILGFALAAAMTFAAGSAVAKIPPPPPPTEEQKAAAEAKKEKDKATAEKAKADQAAAEDRAIANYRDNMKQQGKPVPKPIPVAAQTPPPTGGQPKPESNTVKAAEKSTNAASGGAK